MKSVSGKDLCKALERKGWALVRTKSSHRIYFKPGMGIVSVPVHGNKSLRTGTQQRLMKDAGLDESDL
jgi:predicted RNA binding protein YcfA (HicA-like mRNA interferase family)